MKPEEAFAILEAMAEIHNCKDKLKLIAPNETEAKEELAQEIDTESHEKAKSFSFSKCQILIGTELEYCVEAKLLSGKKHSIAGPRFFKYKGEW